MQRGYANPREWRRGGEAVVLLRMTHLVCVLQVSRALPVRVAIPELPAAPRQAVRQVAAEGRALLREAAAMAVPRHQELLRMSFVLRRSISESAL